MENKFKKISIEEVPDNIEFEGYYWYSDEIKPRILNNEIIDKSIFKDLPFVIEANFYSASHKISLQVKNIDGEYHIGMIHLDSVDDVQEYISHDLDGVKKFRMVEAWEEKEDELLEGMKVLVPSWNAFAGFIK